MIDIKEGKESHCKDDPWQQQQQKNEKTCSVIAKAGGFSCTKIDSLTFNYDSKEINRKFYFEVYSIIAKLRRLYKHPR